jgi:DHA1 family bicyclomycin/chloramphenicol resistance-like MFS transporter
MPESLPVERRAPLTWRRLGEATRHILRTRAAIGYTLTAGLISGAFIGYLNSAQQIFQEQYQVGERFPLLFAILASALGSASLINSRLVMRFGMRWLVGRALSAIVLLSTLCLAWVGFMGGSPPLWSVLVYLLPVFFCIGILFGNMNSLAMEPLGEVAGVGSALVGSVSTLISALLGTVIGQSYNGTIVPLVTGMLLLAILSLLVERWIAAEST